MTWVFSLEVRLRVTAKVWVWVKVRVRVRVMVRIRLGLGLFAPYLYTFWRPMKLSLAFAPPVVFR